VGTSGRRLFEFFRGRKVGENRGTKLSSSHVFYASRGRRKATVPFKTTPFWFLFFNSV